MTSTEKPLNNPLHSNGTANGQNPLEGPDKPRIKKSRKWDVREPDQETTKRPKLNDSSEKPDEPSSGSTVVAGKALPSPDEIQKKISALLSSIASKKTDSTPTAPPAPPATPAPPKSPITQFVPISSTVPISLPSAPTPSFSLSMTMNSLFGSSAIPGEERSKMEAEVKEKAKRLAEIQAKLEKFKTQPKTGPREEEKTTFLPPPLLLDPEGREIDGLGNVINRKPLTVPTLEINKRLQRQQTHDTPSSSAKGKSATEASTDEGMSTAPYYDPRLSIPRSTRAKRTFNFVSPGTYIKKAEKVRSKLRSFQTEEEGQGGKDQVTALQEETPLKKKKRDIIPEVEWWDSVFLAEHQYPGQFDDSDERLAKIVNFDKVTHYIEFPILPKPVGEPPALAALPVMLTKAERKKLRKRNRMEKQRELEEKRLLGLIEAPKPKLRPSNMMRVLGSQAIQDPTAAEKEAKAAVGQRISEHDSRNQARKLSAEERKAKKMKKMEEDTASGLTVCLFKVTDLSHPQKRYKVDINVAQNHLTGCVLLYKEFSLVVVEGGTKATSRFKKLMLRRIDWNSQISGPDEMEDGGSVPVNKCQLVWEGLAAKANFKGFKSEECKTEAQAVKYLKDRGCEHYWDFCKHFDPNINTILPTSSSTITTTTTTTTIPTPTST